MLFADVGGYSQLQEREVPVYLYEFLARVSHRLEALPVQPAFVNSWGDALFVVMNEARPIVDYALAKDFGSQAIYHVLPARGG